MSEPTTPDADQRETLKLSEYRKLGVDDRIQLVHDNCDSIAEESLGSKELPEWQKRELDAALDEYERDPNDVRSWDEVKLEMMSEQGEGSGAS